MVVHSLGSLKVAVYCRQEKEIKKLLQELGISGASYQEFPESDWHVVITDYESYTHVPSTYLRIVLSDEWLDDVNGQIIRIPKALDLVTLHISLVDSAEILGLQKMPYY